jgi:hypothetical protein
MGYLNIKASNKYRVLASENNLVTVEENNGVLRAEIKSVTVFSPLTIFLVFSIWGAC